MLIENTPIEGLVIIKPRRFSDSRGYFSEVYNKITLEKENITTSEFIQDNHSMSREVATVRGLHFQRPPAAQAKLVRVARGSIFDVAVDIRVNSPDFGRWFATELSACGGEQLWIPEGFAHGFMTLEPNTEVLYKVTAPYAPATEGSIRFDDPDLAIEWPLPVEDAKLSDKDAKAPPFSDYDGAFKISR